MELNLKPVFTEKGTYTAIIPELFIDNPDTEFGHYAVKADETIGFIDIKKIVHLKLQDITDMDLYKNFEGFTNIDDLKRYFQSRTDYDERKIVTYIEFDFYPFK